MPPDPTPSETLRAAAARLRECSPFVLIAGKRVAVEPLATWLERDACQIDDAVGTSWAIEAWAAPLAFACSILEQP